MPPMPPATITIDIDPVLHLGGLSVHWYGVAYAVAFWVALRYGAVPHLERRGVPRAVGETAAVWAIVAGLLGARLYYVVQSSPPQGGSWLSHPEEILAVWHGGMAFFGAVIAAPVAVLVFAWRARLDTWLLLDAAAVFAGLGQPIGRLGNVVNGDILGYRSDLPWATAYTNPHAVLQPGFRLGVAYQPAAVYEAIGTLCILAVILSVRRRRDPVPGVLFLVYLALYSVSQVVIFFWRGTEPVVGLGLKQGQWTAIVVGAVAVPALALLWRRGMLDFRGADPPVPAAPEGRVAPTGSRSPDDGTP